MLADDICREIAGEGLDYLRALFLGRAPLGHEMLRRYLDLLDDADIAIASFIALLEDLLAAIHETAAGR